MGTGKVWTSSAMLNRSGSIRPYRGNTTRTSSPKRASAFGSAPVTSARPPVLANGTISADMIRIFRGSDTVVSLLGGRTRPRGGPPRRQEDRAGDRSPGGAIAMPSGKFEATANSLQQRRESAKLAQSVLSKRIENVRRWPPTPLVVILPSFTHDVRSHVGNRSARRDRQWTGQQRYERASR